MRAVGECELRNMELRRGIKLMGKGCPRLKECIGEAMRSQVLRGWGMGAMCESGQGLEE